jgi:membrane protein DedA with SNARE-associated domain
MFGLLAKHTFVAILFAVLLEELGIPMPIPTDLLIIIAGVTAPNSLVWLGLTFLLLVAASTIGASGLYAIVRRGGRPLVARFGRYVHLGPAQLARAEALLKRGGWGGIAIGRAIPGLRYVTVIACGLLDVPYQRFVTAHIAGSSVYIITFLLLGKLFGPTIADYIHLPGLGLHLLWLLALSVGLPLFMIWCCYRAHAQQNARDLVVPSYRRGLGALLLASFAGTTALSAAWATAATLTSLLGITRPLNVTNLLARWLLGRGLQATGAYLAIYSGLLLLCVGIGALYYELILPRLTPHGTSLPRQVLGLVLLGIGLVGSFLVLALTTGMPNPVVRWWIAGGPLLLFALGLGILGYALTTVYSRALAILVMPSLRRIVPPTDDTIGAEDEDLALTYAGGPSDRAMRN